MCVGLYPNTEPCGRALTQGLVGSSPLFLFVLPLAGERGPPVDCGEAVLCWGFGAAFSTAALLRQRSVQHRSAAASSTEGGP